MDEREAGVTRKPWWYGVVAAGAAVLSTAGLSGCAEEAGPTVRADGSPPSASAPASPSAPASSSPPAGASPHVEPNVPDGAPHHGENNAYRRAGRMSAAGEEAARAEARRMEPILERLWKAGTIDPDAVAAALDGLGHTDDELTVRAMRPRYEDSGYVTPKGTLIGLRVAEDACVTGHVRESGFAVEATGPYPETGCIAPPYGH